MKKFRLNIVIRIIVIALLLTSVIYYLIVLEYYLRSCYLIVFVLLALIEFVWFVERTNRDFKVFLMGILQDDFTTTFSEKAKGNSFDQLYGVMNRITRKFDEISAAKEAQYLYLEALVAHLRVGIISYDEKEKVHLMNEAAKGLLELPQMSNLKVLEKVNPSVLSVIRNISPGQNRLLKIVVNNEMQQLNIHASAFKLQGEQYRLVSIQNIKSELDTNEMAAWQRLIRVLTHEIMNSVTPIHSLSSTLKLLIEKNRHNDQLMSDEIKEKLWTGLDAVENRSKGLQSFTKAYRKLTHVPTPSFKKIELNRQLHRLIELLKNELKEVKVTLHLEKTLEVNADPDLLDQALINLLKNAIEAMSDTEAPELVITTSQPAKVIITDNGTGIEKDQLDQIFIPFFTTKKEGSGIGLAITRQIIKLHHGNINVTTQPGKGTSFTITF
ncbi:GHKL domain-containing protein [Fulvivirga sp. M361]|uniref:sensor histidine kinase n=1 Tax=Fulvivirga sp. M361 TaxID=2594266 RepID=UPI00117ADF22|nr:ATP-binding protein [Fulvivirga sp. M361]TRX56271.1 GHKL domain-containing protein [Fulvivirga sp. M361]